MGSRERPPTLPPPPSVRSPALVGARGEFLLASSPSPSRRSTVRADPLPFLLFFPFLLLSSSTISESLWFNSRSSSNTTSPRSSSSSLRLDSSSHHLRYPLPSNNPRRHACLPSSLGSCRFRLLRFLLQRQGVREGARTSSSEVEGREGQGREGDEGEGEGEETTSDRSPQPTCFSKSELLPSTQPSSSNYRTTETRCTSRPLGVQAESSSRPRRSKGTSSLRLHLPSNARRIPGPRKPSFVG